MKSSPTGIDWTKYDCEFGIVITNDGHNSRGENITIYTNGFSSDEVEILVSKLKKMGIKNCHKRKSQECRGSKPEIYIEKSSCTIFLNIIKSYVEDINCMKYKLKGV